MKPEVRARLRAGGVDRFVDLMVDDLLDRPVAELVDPAWLARQLAATARAAAADPQVEAWIRSRVKDVRGRVGAGPVALPRELRGPLEEVLRRPYVPDREVVGRILDHDTSRLLLKQLFQDMLVGFARKLRPALPAAKAPLPAFRGLQKLGENVLGGLGHELEAQLETRAREFMDAGVQRLVEHLADLLCDPKLVREYGDWRVHGLTVILATDQRRLAGELEKLDPDALVATGAALVREVAGSEALVGQLESLLRTAMEEAEGRSLRSLLGGLEVHGLDVLRGVMAQRARALVETPAFEAWWDEMAGER